LRKHAKVFKKPQNRVAGEYYFHLDKSRVGKRRVRIDLHTRYQSRSHIHVTMADQLPFCPALTTFLYFCATFYLVEFIDIYVGFFHRSDGNRSNYKRKKNWVLKSATINCCGTDKQIDV
jgi:hypothetical protein